MKKATIFIICFLCLAFSVSDFSKLKFLILNKLNEYATENYPEKIYIHTDKPYYTAGEDIWFNSYIVNGITHTKSTKSKVIYVELINEEDSIISERKLFTESISVEGDFKLPIDLKKDTYLLRAYTNYMRNQPKDFFFKKQIPVYAFEPNKEITANQKKSEKTKNTTLPNIDFYPEIGYLIAGMSNRIAIKIKGANLSANPIVGIIKDSKGNKVTDFKTQEFGLGSFYINPKMEESYRAVIDFGDEKVSYPLPTPLKEGYVINASVDEKEVLINISTNKKEGLKNTLIIGHQRGLPVFDFILQEDKNSMLLKIPKDDLMEGVLDIVLFNEFEKPVAERLAYIKKKDIVSLSIKNKTPSAGVRDKVNLEIEVKDKFGNLIPSKLSLSVTDTELIKPDNNSGNIKTWLLLNSDLRGKIKSPNYFFTAGESIKKNQLLDLIMLTHGWRRFTWQEFLLQDILPKFKPEDGIYVSGNTVSSKTPYKSKVSETKITFRKKGLYQEKENTDKNGHFSYGPFVFKDSIDVFLQAGEAISSENPNFDDTNIILSPPTQKPNVIPNREIEPFKIGAAQVEKYLKKTRSNIVSNFEFDKERELLDEVVLKNKPISKEQIKNIKRFKRARASAPSHRILVDEMGRHGGGNFMELIANVPGVRIVRKHNNRLHSIKYAVLLRGRETSVYVDNIKVDLNKDALAIPQANIDFIDIINTSLTSSGYSVESRGVIAIYTKQGSREGKPNIFGSKKNSITFKSPGFYNAREFYAPDYSSSNKYSRRPDRRTTLFWEPNIITDGYDNAEVSFYTSDEKGRFQVEVEGITDTGTPIRETAIIEVE